MTAGIGTLLHRMRPADVRPEGALVLLHGRGTDERDLLPLFDAVDPDRRLVGLAPRGPLALTPGGAHWYVVRRIGYPDRDTFLATFDRLAGWFDSIPGELGVPVERTVIGGFSQGGVMSYALALGKGRARPAGIIALSSFIPTVEGLELDLAGRAGLRVAIGHGAHDPVIGVEWGRRARETLEAAGADVTYRESPITHGVDPDFLPELARWVAETIDAAPERSS